MQKYNFAKIADDWWDPDGSMKPIHLINKIRLTYIIDTIKQKQAINSDSSSEDSKFSILDFGAGAGLTSEPLAKLGYDVLGIDISSELIDKAKQHADIFGVNVDYQNIDLDQLQDSTRKFDLILALEVIEHIADYFELIAKMTKLLKIDGILIISTINKTLLAYFVAILGAEYIFNYLEKGTHQYKDFVELSKLTKQLKSLNFEVVDRQGLVYSPFRSWSLSRTNTSVNYILTAQRVTNNKE